MADPAVAPSAPSPSPPAAPPAAPPASSGERISDAHYDNLPADQQARYSRVRASSEGGSVWQARKDLGVDGKPVAPAAPGTTPAADGQVQFRDGRLVFGDHELSGDDVKMLFAEKAARDLRATQVPASAEAYRPELPKDLKLPQGAEAVIDSKDPAFRDLQALAHSRGWSQDDFSSALAIHVAVQAREAVALRTAINAEIAKLGPNGQQRIAALTTWMRSEVGDELGRTLASALMSEKHVLAFERLASKAMNQGAANFSQSYREPSGGDGKVSDEDYQRMGPAQRWNYSRSFDQSKFQK